MRKILTLLILMVGSFVYGQQGDVVDFKRITARITPDFQAKSILGSVTYEFEILTETDSIYLDAHIDEIMHDYASNNARVELNSGKIWVVGQFQANSSYELDLVYEVQPKQTFYFFEDQIWTQGQGKYTSYWLPSLDDMSDKIEFDISLVLSPELNAISNGKLITKDISEENIQWHFDMEKPMSSYLVMIAAGKFDKQTLESKAGIPIENYYIQGEEQTVEPTYRYTKEIFDYFEEKIGVPYPWQNYKQVPVRDFLYAGMENTTATVFSSAFVVDSIGFNDKNYVNVNAHELAHQWFGNLVTEVSAADHWLHEGFASYYALLAERKIFGDDYYYWKLFQTAEQLRARSDAGKGEALSNPKASSLTFYEKGTWALIMLEELLGTFDFDAVIKSFLNQYAFKNATLDDFFAVATKVSGKDLTEFRQQWIEQSSFPAMAALNYLSESPFLNEYMELEVRRNEPLAAKKKELAKALNGSNEYLGQEAVVQLSGEPMGQVLELYDLALSDPHFLVRQTVVQSISEIPIALKSSFEQLLQDESYVTQEIVLFRLWQEFPQDRAKYLDRMESAVGFREKNLRQLWLTLASVTQGYRTNNKQRYMLELMGYSGPEYSFETRDLALNYLTEINAVNETVLRNLMNACVHPNWRFRSSARELLNKQLDNPIALSKLKEIRSSLPKKEMDYLDRVLE